MFPISWATLFDTMVLSAHLPQETIITAHLETDQYTGGPTQISFSHTIGKQKKSFSSLNGDQDNFYWSQ